MMYKIIYIVKEEKVTKIEANSIVEAENLFFEKHNQTKDRILNNYCEITSVVKKNI